MLAKEIKKYMDILEDAECKAKDDNELDFVYEMMDEFDEYGGDAHVSDEKLDKLDKIVKIVW